MSRRDVITNTVEELSPVRAAQSTPVPRESESEIEAEIDRLGVRLSELGPEIEDSQKEKRKSHDNLVSGSGSAEDAAVAREKLSALTKAADEIRKQLESKRKQLAAIHAASRKAEQM